MINFKTFLAFHLHTSSCLKVNVFFAADIQDGGRKTCATRRNRIVYSIQEVGMVSKGDKANFRRACKKFNITNEQYRKGKMLVITCKKVEHQKHSTGITYPTT